MKKLIYTLILVVTPMLANAELLVQREIFNALSGENYVCKIHSDLKTELVSEGVSLGKFNTEFSASTTDFKKWLDELKAQAKSNPFAVVPKPKNRNPYTIRGFKRYSLFVGKDKLPFYSLEPATKIVSRGKRQFSSLTKGSVERKTQNDKANVQRVRGETDFACKRAMARI